MDDPTSDSHPRRPAGGLRPLRPIGVTAAEVAARTGRLLTGLITRPGVHLWTGIRVVGGRLPITHVLGAGRLVLLVESVAWPAGTYSTTADGGVRCDGVYIGQSVGPFLDTMREARRTLPDDYLITGVVVVHPSGGAAPTLPETGPDGLDWTPPGALTSRIRRQLRRHRSYCQDDINVGTVRAILTGGQR